MTALCATIAGAQPTLVQKQWGSEFDGPPKVAPTRFAMVETTAEGPVFGTGRICTQFGATSYLAAWRVESDGTVAWMYAIAGTGSSECYGVAIAIDRNGPDPYGRVFVTGVIDGSAGKDIRTVALDAATGLLIWERTYNNAAVNGDDEPVVIVYDALSDAVYVAGNSEGATITGSSTASDYVVVKYDGTTGADLWATPFRYDGPAHGKDHVADLAVASRRVGSQFIGHVFVTGSSQGVGSNSDYLTVRINEADPTQFIEGRANAAGYSSDYATGIAVLPEIIPGTGRVWVTGHSDGRGTVDYWTIALDYDLMDNVWLPNPGQPKGRWYDGAGNGSDKAVKIIYGTGALSGPYLYVTGESWGGFATGYDFATIRYNPDDGEPLWISTFDNLASNAEDRATDMVTDKDGNCYVGGTSFNLGTFDLAAICYQPSGDSRWIEIDGSGQPTGRDYVTHNGSANGKDAGTAIRVTRDPTGQVGHFGRVYHFGTVLGLGPGQVPVDRFGLVRYDQFEP